jgi:hypothetical protein
VQGSATPPRPQESAMTATSTSPASIDRQDPYVRTGLNTVGLVLGVLLSIADFAGLGLIGSGSDDEAGPPAPVLIFCAVMGVLTIVGVVALWRGGSRRWLRLAAGSRVLSAVTSLPAFFVDDVSASLKAVSALGILVTVGALMLMAARPKHT